MLEKQLLTIIKSTEIDVFNNIIKNREEIFGELNYPSQSKGEAFSEYINRISSININRVCVKYSNLKIETNDQNALCLYADVSTVGIFGNTFKEMIETKVKYKFACRAIGNFLNNNFSREHVITWDITNDNE